MENWDSNKSVRETCNRSVKETNEKKQVFQSLILLDADGEYAFVPDKCVTVFFGKFFAFRQRIFLHLFCFSDLYALLLPRHVTSVRSRQHLWWSQVNPERGNNETQWGNCWRSFTNGYFWSSKFWVLYSSVFRGFFQWLLHGEWRDVLPASYGWQSARQTLHIQTIWQEASTRKMW